MTYAGRNHIVIGFLLLQHQIHRLYIITRKSPIAPCLEIAERKMTSYTQFDFAERNTDFTRNKVFATSRRLVIEENPRTYEEAVLFPVSAHILFVCPQF